MFSVLTYNLFIRRKIWASNGAHSCTHISGFFDEKNRKIVFFNWSSYYSRGYLLKRIIFKRIELNTKQTKKKCVNNKSFVGVRFLNSNIRFRSDGTIIPAWTSHYSVASHYNIFRVRVADDRCFIIKIISQYERPCSRDTLGRPRKLRTACDTWTKYNRMRVRDGGLFIRPRRRGMKKKKGVLNPFSLGDYYVRSRDNVFGPMCRLAMRIEEPSRRYFRDFIEYVYIWVNRRALYETDARTYKHNLSITK